MIQKIKTNIKFKQEEETGKLFGFVTKNKNGSWRGVSEQSGMKKKIVLVDRHMEPSMQPNVLYSVVLIPMENDNGFVAISAKLMQFDAKIETVADEKKFSVTVHFGNKVIKYDPTSKRSCENNIQYISKLLRSRVDLKSKEAVAEEFLDCACLVNSIYKRSMEV